MSNFSIFHQQPSGYIKGAVSGFVKAAASGIPKTAAKGIIHTARFIWDFATDIVNFGVKLFDFAISNNEQEASTIEKIDANAQHAKGTIDANAHNAKDIINANAQHAKDIIAKREHAESADIITDEQIMDNSEHADLSYLAQAKAFVVDTKNAVVDTWCEKDTLVTGQVSNMLNNFPLVKAVADVASLCHVLVKTVAIEVVHAATLVNIAGLEAAYAAGEVQTEHTLIPVNFDPVADYVSAGSIESEFVKIDLTGQSEKGGIEMTSLVGADDIEMV